MPHPDKFIGKLTQAVSRLVKDIRTVIIDHNFIAMDSAEKTYLVSHGAGTEHQYPFDVVNIHAIGSFGESVFLRSQRTPSENRRQTFSNNSTTRRSIRSLNSWYRIRVTAKLGLWPTATLSNHVSVISHPDKCIVSVTSMPHLPQ